MGFASDMSTVRHNLLPHILLRSQDLADACIRLGNLQTGLNEDKNWPSVDGVCKHPPTMPSHKIP